MMKCIFDIDSSTLKIDRYSKINSKVDYAVFSSDVGVIWYDMDNGFQVKKIEPGEYATSILFNYDSEIIVKKIDLKNTKTKMTYYHIPCNEYTEESYFMESTVHDFGDFTYDDYIGTINLVHELHRLIRELE